VLEVSEGNVSLNVVPHIPLHPCLPAVIRHHYPELLNTTGHPSSSNGSGVASDTAQEAAEQPSTSTTSNDDSNRGASAAAAGGDSNVYVRLLREVCRRTGVLVALWQVG
jgi:hypothetical protein